MEAAHTSVQLVGDGLVLREWTEEDLPLMRRLFDDPQVAYRTTLASPFGQAAAVTYLAEIRRTRASGERLHLAITGDGSDPMGEIILNASRGTIGYAVGAAYRGRRLALRSLKLVTDYAHWALGLPRAILQIEADNSPSLAVAQAAGFRPADDAAEWVEDKGRCFAWMTWAHEVDIHPTA